MPEKIAKISMKASDILSAIPYMKLLNVTNVYIVKGAVIMYAHLPDWHQMNNGGVQYLLPFLEKQNLPATEIPFTDLMNYTYDIDMDLKYKSGWDLVKGDIYTINALFYGVYPDMTKPFLYVEDVTQSDVITIAHTARHINPVIDFTILNEYSNDKIFIGTESEYQFFLNYLNCGRFKYGCMSNLQFVNTSDMYHASKIIKSSKLFISNQTSYAVVAEGIAQNRILCVDKNHPNYVTKTPNGRSVLTNRFFEKNVREMLS